MRHSAPGKNDKSRALRGFEGGGPTRTRTVDQRIMSHDHVKSHEQL